jgi:hypothetical protein
VLVAKGRRHAVCFEKAVHAVVNASIRLNLKGLARMRGHTLVVARTSCRFAIAGAAGWGVPRARSVTLSRSVISFTLIASRSTWGGRATRAIAFTIVASSVAFPTAVSFITVSTLLTSIVPTFVITTTVASIIVASILTIVAVVASVLVAPLATSVAATFVVAVIATVAIRVVTTVAATAATTTTPTIVIPRTRISLRRAEVFARGWGSGAGTTSLLNAQSPTINFLALEAFLGSFGLVRSNHLDKPKATGFFRMGIAHDLALLDITIFLEHFRNLGFCQSRMNAGYKEVWARVDCAIVILMLGTRWILGATMIRIAIGRSWPTTNLIILFAKGTGRGASIVTFVTRTLIFISIAVGGFVIHSSSSHDEFRIVKETLRDSKDLALADRDRDGQWWW